MSRFSFTEWLKKTKGTISRPDKYASTVETITNDLKKKDIAISSLFDLSDPSELEKLKNQYLQIDDYFEKNKRGNRMYSRAFDLLIEYANADYEDAVKDIKATLDDKNIPITERISIAKSRIGQGVFRDGLVSYWEKCSVTGYEDVRFLRASHIKPWKASNNQERLDIYNGLLLLPTLDLVFDKGFITFDERGKIVISKHLYMPNALGISNGMSVNIRCEHIQYMEYHRDKVFEKIA